MRIAPISQNNNKPSFGIKFRLSEEAIKAAEESTGLTYEEMTRLPLSETSKLMKERGTLKEPSKLFLWLQDKYKKFGEKTGLLKKEYHFYNEV